MELASGELALASQLPPERKPRELHAHSWRLWKESYLSSDFISPVGCPQTLSHMDCSVGALIGLFVLSLWEAAGPLSDNWMMEYLLGERECVFVR